ncbi:MAG: hypothetical protein GEU98_01630 [Pseudonocardiaceae bacterium]|nr:hypothetical protein [Pseudonocardiaceae bacterium]
MSERITVDQFDQLYETFERTAWRWETQPAYHEPSEAEPFRRWRAGEPDDLEWLTGWLETLRAAHAAGRQFQRVRVHHDPLTVYQRWGLDVITANVAAGEDIRVLPIGKARELGVPGEDFCLFDDRSVALMFFGNEGMSGAELITEAAEVARYRQWSQSAWQHAIPFYQYRDNYFMRST